MNTPTTCTNILHIVRPSYNLQSTKLDWGVGYKLLPLANATYESVINILDNMEVPLVINRAFTLPADQIRKLAIRYPSINWLTVNHSSQSHLTNGLLEKQQQFIELSLRYDNCYLGTPDERILLHPWSKLVWIPNPIPSPSEKLSSSDKGTTKAWITLDKKQPTKRLPDTLTLSLICRRDWVKNIPNQILGAAIANQRLADQPQPCKLKLILSINGFADDLVEYGRSLDLHILTHRWQEGSAYQQFLRHNIDIGLQVSFSESFNYVGLDHLGLGIPVVGSSALRYLPAEWQAHADDPSHIANRIIEVASMLPLHEPCEKIVRRLADRNNPALQRLLDTLTKKATPVAS